MKHDRASLSTAFLTLPLLALFSLPITKEAAAAQTRYLSFQMFTSQWTKEQATTCGANQIPSEEQIAAVAENLVRDIGTTGTADRKLAIMIGPITWDHTDDQIKQIIAAAFSVSRKTGVAVGFHLDDYKYTNCRTDLHADPANIEKVDWNAPPSTAIAINWGLPFTLAPQFCLNAPAITHEVIRRIRDVFAPALKAELVRTPPDLFAGIIAGWETVIERDAATGKRNGYCALANLGYSAQNPPTDTDKQLQTILKDWISLWTHALAAAGIPKDKLYSHITFELAKDIQADTLKRGETYSHAIGHAVPQTAFGDTHLAGFSTYPHRGWYEALYTELEHQGSPPWVSSEGANVLLEPGGGVVPTEGMETYLARMFNHGAVMTNVFGYRIAAPANNVFRHSAEAPESIAAYKKFLNGEPLHEVPLEQSYLPPPDSIKGKIERIRKAIPAYAQRGGDLKKIETGLQEFFRTIETSPNQAQEILDRILNLVDQN